MNDGARRPADTYPGPRPAHRSGGAPPTAELGISARIREKFEQDGSFGKLWRSETALKAASLATIPPVEFFRDPRSVRFFLSVRPYTLLSYSNLKALGEIARAIVDGRIEGDVVECGVWNGGSAARLAKSIEATGRRDLWLFDSWQGVPEPTERDVERTGRVGTAGLFAGSEDRAKAVIHTASKISLDRVHFVPGWFSDTIPITSSSIDRVALLHIDCDFHDPVRLCLQEFFPRLVPGGFVVINDYSNWSGCREAVDEFVRSRSEKLRIVPIGEGPVYFRAP
ncbi:MAG: TylF/MycF/NovP-related O-methyltransferase [Thermoplasmata archaeon]